MLLTIWFVFLAVVLLILSLPFYLITLLWSKKDPLKAAAFGQTIVRLGMAGMMYATFSRIDVRGRERIPRDTPVLFISNHRSYLDIFMGYGFTPKQFGFVAKMELEKLPYIKSWMELLHCLFLNRGDRREGLETILQAIAYVKKGSSIWICPEGTRAKTGPATELLMFHNGSFKIASKADVPVVPVAIYGTREMLEDHMPKLTRGHIVMEFGEPVRISELDPAEQKKVGDHFQEIVKNMLEKIDAEMH